MKRTFVYIGRNAVTGILLIVCCKMFDAGHHALTLKTNDIAGGNLTGQIRILSEIFEISSAKRRAIDVGSRSEKNMNSACARILTEGDAHLVNQVTVPGRCCCDTARIKGALRVIPHPLRAVCHPDCRQSEPVNGTDVPVLEATHILGFLPESHH